VGGGSPNSAAIPTYHVTPVDFPFLVVLIRVLFPQNGHTLKCITKKDQLQSCHVHTPAGVADSEQWTPVFGKRGFAAHYKRLNGVSARHITSYATECIYGTSQATEPRVFSAHHKLENRVYFRHITSYRTACICGTSQTVEPHVFTTHHKLYKSVYTSVSQPPGRGPVPGPGINYAGPREA